MASFTIGDFRFDVISHERTLADGYVRERFVVDAFYRDAPLNWHPNQTRSDDYPGLPNRTNYEFVGREVVDVYAGFDGDRQLSEAEVVERQPGEQPLEFRVVGTKRGADFRTRFWRNLMYHARLALMAANTGRRIGEVANSEIDHSSFTEPDDLSKRTLDEAVAELTR